MTLEVWSTIGAVGSLVVLSCAAFAAIVQLRHMRANNQLQAILSIERDFNEDRIQDALAFVQTKLDEALQEPTYRAQLTRRGYIDARVHPEMIVSNWFDQAGMLVKGGFVDEDVFFEAHAKLAVYCWDKLTPVIALLRRERGITQYESFEYLAVRARKWRERHPHGTYPSNAERAHVPDMWAIEDGHGPSTTPVA